jgi:hypothetical protein
MHSYILKILTFSYLFFQTSAYSQIGLKLNLESGAYINANTTSYSKINSIHKIYASLDFKKKIDNSEFYFGGKVRPQFLSNEFHSMKYKLDASYGYNFENISWHISLSKSDYSYLFSSQDYSYGYFYFLNHLEFKPNDKLPVNIFIGYSNNKMKYYNKVNSDYIFISALVNNIIDNYSFIGLGLYLQKFDTESKLKNISLSSVGWKYGPQVKLQYMRTFLFDAEYKFLIYNSNNTIFPSYEHNVNLLCGTILSEKISLFLLTEFSFIRTSLKKDLGEQNPVYYTPTQNENEIYMKITYKLNSTFSIYTKTGYFRENIYLDDYKLDGLNLLLGIELKN